MANKDVVVQIRADEDFWRMVDDWRRVQPDLPTRSEAVRRMVRATALTIGTATTPPASQTKRRQPQKSRPK
jgi:hypothetical protein